MACCTANLTHRQLAHIRSAFVEDQAEEGGEAGPGHQPAPPGFQEERLPRLEDAVARGEASPRDLAYLMDRARLLAAKGLHDGNRMTGPPETPEFWPRHSGRDTGTRLLCGPFEDLPVMPVNVQQSDYRLTWPGCEQRLA